MIRIQAIGGYGEIGRNMTLVTVGEESILLDMGIHMDHLVQYEHHAKNPSFTKKELYEYDVLPNDRRIDKKKVLAIIPSHGHLDHIAAIPYLAKSYSCPIYCTRYTSEIVRKQFSDSKITKQNKILSIPFGERFSIGSEFEVEFFPITHSIPDSSLILIHTKFGTVVYANDFKLDMFPTFGEKPNLELLQKNAGDVTVLISECLRAKHIGHTASEIEAKELLEELVFSPITEKKGIFITTFSSHIERLKTIVSFAKRLKRKVLVLGRSLDKYLYAAKKANVTSIIDQLEVVPFKSQVKRRLKRLANEDLSKYVVMMTGHQGEENAVLNNMITGGLPNVFKKGDVFIFSCNAIPTLSILEAREKLEEKLIQKGLQLFKDIHVSGHASREDLRVLLTLLRPKYVIPSHGTKDMMDAYTVMAKEMGYVQNESIIYLYNSDEKYLS